MYNYFVTHNSIILVQHELWILPLIQYLPNSFAKNT